MTATMDIVENMERQATLYRRLLDLSQAQLVALRERDVQSVHALLQEIEMEMLNRSRLEIRRSELLERLSLETGVPVEEITASRVSELADPAIADRIEYCSQELQSLLGDLDEVVERNQVVLQQELSLIDHMVHAVTSTDSPVYAQGGVHADAPKRRLLDAQV